MSESKRLRLLLSLGLHKYPVSASPDDTLSNLLDDFVHSNPLLNLHPPLTLRSLRAPKAPLQMNIPIKQVSAISHNSILLIQQDSAIQVSSDATVKVAIVLEDKRYEAAFALDRSLWSILKEFEALNNVRICTKQVEGTGEYLMPVVLISGSVRVRRSLGERF
jgi:hypothetical protein